MGKKDKGNSTIRINDETKKKLNKLKTHPRQSYDEVISKLMR